MDARTRRINGIIERSTSNEKWPEGGRGGGGGSREEVKRERERELWWLVTMPCYGGGRVIMIL